VTAPEPPASFGPPIDWDARRALVIASGTLNGVDFVEVLPDRLTLLVRLLARPGTVTFDPGTVRITGGVRADPRVNPVHVLWVYLAAGVLDADHPPPGVTAGDREMVSEALLADDEAAVLVVRTSSSGDSSPYRLHLLGPDLTQPPAGFDPVLSEMPFSFRADDADDPRAVPPADVAPQASSPLTDYLARDAGALSTRLLDRFASLVPGWDDRNPADVAVMLMEIFAALGDRLAYWQDAVAVEAFLGTARQRASVRRHARLLGYDVGEGCSARAWLAFATPTRLLLRAGRAVADTDMPAGATAADAAAAGAVVFQTRADRLLLPARTAIELYAWAGRDPVLPVGSRSAFLVLPDGAPDPGLQRGDVLVLADCPADPPRADTPEGRFQQVIDNGDPTLRFAVRLDQDPVRRHDPLTAHPFGSHPCPEACCPAGPGRIVLEIHWYADDMLPRPLPVCQPGPGGGAPVALAVALANVVAADEGASAEAEPLLPPAPAEGEPFRPRLRGGAPAWVDPGWNLPPDTADGMAPVPLADTRPAATLQRPDPVNAVPALTLTDGRRTWTARRDLLSSGRPDPDFVVEPDGRGGARLRFGDGINGRLPDTQLPLTTKYPEYRVGGGSRGNVAAGRLVHLLPATSGGADPLVWNPLPALGGADPEDAERARRLAPAGLRSQERAVTSADYAAAAAQVAGVQRSAARRQWNGSWYTQDVAVDPLGAEELSADLAAAVRAQLERRRMADTDVAVRGPAYAALRIALTVQVQDGFARLQVEGRVRDAVSDRALPGGRLGFFHPDRLTFGQPVYLSDLVVTVTDVAGADSVEVTRFGRLSDSAEAAARSLAAGAIVVHELEVARCDSDPNQPEAGRVELTTVGGA
jgi:hypothetical protein